MRIVMLVTDLNIPLGGMKAEAVHVRSVAAALLRAGHQVSALVATPGAPETFAPLVASGLDVRVLRQPRTVRELDWHFSQVNPDLVIERLALLSPEGALAAAEAGVPHVYEVNAPLDLEAARHRNFDRVPEARAAFTQGFAVSRGAIAVSEEVARWVGTLAPEGFPVHVQSNGADPSFLNAADAKLVRRIQERLRLGSGEFRIGFVGSFRPWHDLDTLLHAADDVAVHTPVRLLLIGDGPQRNHLLRTAWSCRAAVTLTGLVPHDEMAAHLALCDVVAVPYAPGADYFSPIKLVEAMAASRPVVATATGPVQSVVSDGVNGLLIEAGDRAGWSTVIRRLALEPSLRGRLGAEARRTVERGHLWDEVVARMLAFAAPLGTPRKNVRTA
ncbi:MAG: hypothetical protein RL760_933 [Candidatus Eisenbacteria bacterium]